MKKIKFINIVLVMCLLISCMAHSGIYAAVPETPDSTMAILPPLTHKYVTLSKSSATLSLGEGILLTATLSSSASTNEISWYSSNTSVATVTNGFVSAISPGTATITVSYDGPVSQSGTTTDTCVVTVTGNQLFENGTYFFENAATGNFANTNNYSSVNTQALSGEMSEKWFLEFKSNGAYYTIRSEQTGGYLIATSTGNAVTQTSSTSSVGNRFRFMKIGTEKYAIVPVNVGGSTPTVVSLPSSGSSLISAAYTSNTDYRDEWEIHRMLPLSGSELDFGMYEWTLDGCEKIEFLNCYAYAINNQTNRSGNVFFWNDPGCYSNTDISGFEIDPLNNGIIEGALFNDYNAYNNNNNTNYIVRIVDQYEQCPQGTYKIALVITAYGESNKFDYHWYRQDSDGLWSHKRGSNDPTREDALGKLIIDPQYANRHYGNYNYTAFVNYYAVTPWNNYYLAGDEYLSIDEPVMETNLFSVTPMLFSQVKVGMTIDEVYDILGSLGDPIGSGRLICEYCCSDGSRVCIGYLYNVEKGTLTVYDISNGGLVQ